MEVVVRKGSIGERSGQGGIEGKGKRGEKLKEV